MCNLKSDMVAYNVSVSNLNFAVLDDRGRESCQARQQANNIGRHVYVGQCVQMTCTSLFEFLRERKPPCEFHLADYIK